MATGSGVVQDGGDPRDNELPGPLLLRMSSMEKGVRCEGCSGVTTANTGTDMSVGL